jgi:hypothetical protein
MNWKRIATLGVFGGALAVWLAGAATSNARRPIDTIVTEPTQVELHGAELAAEIARLRDRLHPTTEPQHPGRNLFQFSRRTSATRAAAPAPAATLSEAPAVVKPAPPALQLVGVAEDQGPDGPVRTAIISAFGQLYFVKPGDTVGSRYRVEVVSGEVTELTDLVDSTKLRIALQ